MPVSLRFNFASDRIRRLVRAYFCVFTWDFVVNCWVKSTEAAWCASPVRFVWITASTSRLWGYLVPSPAGVVPGPLVCCRLRLGSKPFRAGANLPTPRWAAISCIRVAPCPTSKVVCSSLHLFTCVRVLTSELTKCVPAGALGEFEEKFEVNWFHHAERGLLRLSSVHDERL